MAQAARAGGAGARRQDPAPLNLRREISQADPQIGQYIGYLDWVTDQGWQRYHGLLLSFQRRAANGLSSSANYTWRDGVQTSTQRVNQVPDNPHGKRTLDNWFNPAAFEQPAIGTHGNSAYNAYRGPGSRVIDLALVRSFSLRGAQRIEARVEAFNAFNWFRWGDPVNNFSSATFGRILSAGDPRIMQFALKYQF